MNLALPNLHVKTGLFLLIKGIDSNSNDNNKGKGNNLLRILNEKRESGKSFCLRISFTTKER